MMAINKEMGFDKTKYLNFKDETKSFGCVERFNQHKLNHIIENFNDYVPIMKEDIEKRQNRVNYDYDPLAISKTYLEKSRKGKINTTFIQKKNIGRFQALKSISLQTLPRKIRHTIASEFYNDIDIKNCHPVLLQWLGKQLLIPTPNLSLYIENRKEFLDKFNLTKMGVISLIYGAKPKYGSDETVYALYNELNALQHKIIYELYPDEFNNYRRYKFETGGKLDNITGSFMSKFLQDIENELLQAIRSFYGCNHECIPCFDGLLVPKEIDLELEKCQQYVINNTGIPIELAQKDMEEILPIPDNINAYQEIELDFFDQKRHLVEMGEVEKHLIDEWIFNSICYVEERRNYYIREQKRDEVSNERYIVWTEIDSSSIQKDLYLSVSVKNDQYDKRISNEVIDLTPQQKKKYFRQNPSHICKINRYLATKLYSNSKDEKGYLNDVFTRRFRASKVLKPNDCLKSYNNIQFMPYLKRKGPPCDMSDTLNIWTEFPLERVKLTKTKSFEDTHLYQFIKEVLCDNRMDEFNHLLDTIADIIQEPHKVKANSHFFYGRQGIGKSTFATFLSALVGGKNCVSYSNNLDGLRQFNSDSANVLLKVYEEVETRGSVYSNSNRLKGEITERKTRQEKKHKDPVFMRNCARLFFFSNNKNVIYIEGDCRRYTFHSCNNSYACNTEYYSPILEEIENISLMRTIFEYFATREYEYKVITKCFDTAFKQEQKMKDLPNGIKFLIDFARDNFVYEDEWEEKNVETLFNNDKIPVKNLRKAYGFWCREQGKKFNFESLKTQLSKLEIQEKSRCSVGGNKRMNCYILNKKILEDTLKIFFRDDSYEIVLDED